MNSAIDSRIIALLERGPASVEQTAAEVGTSQQYVRLRLSLLVEDGSVVRSRPRVRLHGHSRLVYELMPQAVER